jgi:hypothetical protein
VCAGFFVTFLIVGEERLDIISISLRAHSTVLGRGFRGKLKENPRQKQSVEIKTCLVGLLEPLLI